MMITASSGDATHFTVGRRWIYGGCYPIRSIKPIFFGDFSSKVCTTCYLVEFFINLNTKQKRYLVIGFARLLQVPHSFFSGETKC